MTQTEWLVEGTSTSGHWRVGRIAAQREDCILVRLTAPDGIYGQACAPYSDALRREMQNELTAKQRHDRERGNGNPIPSSALLPRGLMASAELDLASRRHRVPLSLWLGGAMRNAVRVMVPIALRTREVAQRGSELKNAARQMRDYQQLLGIDSFAICDSSNDIDLISSSLFALRSQTALGATVMLRLAGQFDACQTRELCSKLHGCGLTCIADPCASIGMAIQASLNQLPALGLCVWRYEREELLKYLPETPPAVLLVDPLLEGGATAVRKLASIARVLQTEICLTAEAGGSWLTNLCAEIAAVVPASLQPVQLPSGLSIPDLRTLGVSAGKLPLPGLPGVSCPEATVDGDNLMAGQSLLPSPER